MAMVFGVKLWGYVSGIATLHILCLVLLGSLPTYSELCNRSYGRLRVALYYLQ